MVEGASISLHRKPLLFLVFPQLYFFFPRPNFLFPPASFPVVHRDGKYASFFFHGSFLV